MADYDPKKDAHDSYFAAVEAKRKRGDKHWPEKDPWKRVERIGDVTLYLGDSTAIVPVLEGFDAVVTDPPFGMAFRSNHRAVKHEAIAGDGETELLQWACGLEAGHSKYVFCRWDNLRDIPKPKSLVTWVKNNWSMGDLAHEHGRQTEVAAFYPGPNHDFPKARPSDVIHAPRTGNEHHPTEKPVQLMAAILEWTRGTVLDPFMGAGSTGVAAVRMGRPFIGIELHEPYFEIAVKRIRDAAARPDLFAGTKAESPKQESLFGGEAA
ncbi:DNA-methyltransferase [Nitratireductor sp. CH_MIT9313-5]|uniref:DNA-methyltransferase n=1 Tax=Nitratireductor sp. CH_MIT9313-5 TaxID=3107764 RepID=UPI00300B5387